MTASSRARARCAAASSASASNPWSTRSIRDEKTAQIETEVTFEDGRKGTMRATLKIRDARKSQPLRKAG